MARKKETVLIVDDDAVVRKMIAGVLSEEGYPTVEAADGESGFAALKGSNAKIVISDIVMPKCDGVEFLKRARNYDMTVQVIMITAYHTLDRCIEAIENGALGYVCKPCDAAAVIKNVRRAERRIRERIAMLQDIAKKQKMNQGE